MKTKTHKGALRPAMAMGAVVLAGLMVTVAAEKPVFTKQQKASYLTEQELAFIRPGLSLKILEGSIDDAGTVSFRFMITDPKGLPLDINGVFTPGEVSVRPVAAFIPRGEELYRSYIEVMRTSPITGDTATQAARDRTGTVEQVGEGEYIYTFGNRVPLDFDRTATHTIAVWALRDLEEFDLGEESDSDIFHFVPDGSEVTVTRDIVSDAACNQCHGDLSAHDQRKKVGLCITCHTPQSTDPDTGNSVDFTTMIHKIHMGAELPSVQAGTPYQIIGFRQSVHDYSTVEFPADVRRCETCHQNATQADHYLTEPSMRSCGSCHDNVNFATGENHARLPQVSDNQCRNCHIPEGELEFDLSIIGAHTVEQNSKQLPGTNFEILSVVDTAPGRKPTVRFSIRNDTGEPVDPPDMGRLALVMAGNTADFSRVISESATTAEGSAGEYSYEFESPIPEDAQGSWAVGIEGYQSVTLLPGTLQERTNVRDPGDNDVFYFPVTDAETQPRRRVVGQQKCDSCHYDLQLHGSNRNDVEHCVLCHNPNTTDVARRPEEEGAPESVNFRVMIHKIHTGEELDDRSKPYVIFGFRSSRHEFSEVRFPGDRANCETCHISGTQQLPLQEGILPTQTPRDLFNPTPPTTSACLSCHTSLSAAAHADLNISGRFGEACAVCHGSEADFSVDRVHAR